MIVMIEEDLEIVVGIEVTEVLEVEVLMIVIVDLMIDQKDASIVDNKVILQKIVQSVNYLLFQLENQGSLTMIEIHDKVIEEEEVGITKVVMTETTEEMEVEVEIEIEIAIEEEMIAEVTAAEVEIERENKREEAPLHHLQVEVVDLMKY
jgi:hypothetical protein